MRLGQRLAGLVAMLVLLGILVGLPLALLAVGPTVLPGGVPSPGEIWTRVRTPDDGTLTLGIVVLVGWVVWLFLAVSIVLELVARVRGGAAPRVPGLGLGQSAARGLVGTALLLFVAVPVGAGAVSASASPMGPGDAGAVASGPSAGHSVLDTDSPEWQAFSRAAAQKQAADATDGAGARDGASDQAKGVATQAHSVERGESLWSIAEHYLGDGDRYTEIAQLNRATLGADPGFLVPGTVLQVPAVDRDASAAGDEGERAVTVQLGDSLSAIAQAELGDADRYPELVEANLGVAQPDGDRLSDPDLIHPGWVITVPGDDAASGGPTDGSGSDADGPDADGPDGDGPDGDGATGDDAPDDPPAPSTPSPQPGPETIPARNGDR